MSQEEKRVSQLSIRAMSPFFLPTKRQAIKMIYTCNALYNFRPFEYGDAFLGADPARSSIVRWNSSICQAGHGIAGGRRRRIIGTLLNRWRSIATVSHWISGPVNGGR